MGECNLSHFLDAMCWGVLLAAVAWGCIAGYCFHKHMYSKALLRMLLYMLWRMHQRGVYMSSHDLATISVALDHVRKGSDENNA